jgi:hypothetical protein
MALPDLTGQNIENTYQRIVQTDGTNFYDGTGSLVILPSANTASLLTTASAVGNTITFTKGNASQFSITVDTGSGGTIDTSSLVTTSSFNAFTSSINQFTSSYNTGSFSGSFIGTASWANNSITASYVLNAVSSSFASTASYVLNAQTASYVLNAISSSFASTASYVLNAVSASYVQTAQTASYYQEVDPIFVAKSASLATTGSNIFIGNQTVTGSLFTTGSNTLVGSTSLTGSLNITGSTLQIGNNTLLGNTTLSGSITISGSLGTNNPTVRIYGDTEHNGYIRFDPVTTNIDTTISASYIYVSGSTNDLYFSQNSSGYNNVTRLRWLEGNLYTGLLHGGALTQVNSNTYRVASGSGIIVNINASLTDDPYPTIQFLEWDNLTKTIDALSASFDQQFIAISSSNQIHAQGTPYFNGEVDTYIPIGIVLHQNRSTINGVKTQPSLAYGWKQRSNVFISAFGPLKISGHALATSSSRGLTVGNGTSFADGANYPTDPENPSYVIDPGTNVSKIFRYRQSGSNFVYDTNGGIGYTTIDPTQYSLNGTLTGVANNSWSIQRVFWYPNSVSKAIVVYYGNAVYSTESEAIANINIETFSEAPNTAANAIYVGAVIIKGDGTFAVDADFTILPGGLFRGVGGGGGGGGTTTPGGSNTQIQYNNNGAFGGVPNLTWDGTTLHATGSFTGSFTGSLQGTSSWANNSITASYALNGGVTQLLAGPNISLSPTNGLGQVEISSTGGGGVYGNTATGSYGSFYDTTTQTNPVINVIHSMSLNTTDISNGVSISGSTSPYNTYIKIENAGVYDIQFSAQLEKTSPGGTNTTYIWLRKNGIDLAETNTAFELSQNGKGVAAWNWFVNSATNDYYQIMWSSNANDTQLIAETPIVGPAVPSVILTVNRVDQFLSNTGSFSGSFTGDFTGSLLGTSSWATNALTASYLNPLTQSVEILGNITIHGTASVDILVTNYQSSSIIYSSGSTKFGDTLDDTHEFTGSIFTTGSISSTGTVTAVTGSFSYLQGNSPITVGDPITFQQAITASSISASVFYGDGSNLVGTVSSSYSATSSFNPNAIVTASATPGAYTIRLTKGNGTYFDVALTQPAPLPAPTTNTGSFFTNATLSNDRIVFTTGDRSFVALSLTSSYVLVSQTSSFVQNFQTSSFVNNDQTSSFVQTSSFNNFTQSIQSEISSLTNATSSYVQNSQTSSFVTNSQTSSFVQNSQTSSFITNNQTSSMLEPYVLITVTSSMLEPYLLNSQTSSFVQNSQTSSFVNNNQTSSFVQNSQTSSFVLNSQTSSMLEPYLLSSQTGSFLTLNGSLLDINGDIQFNENRLRTSSTTVGQPGKGSDIAYDWGDLTTAPTAGRIVYFASGSGGFGWRDALANATGSSAGLLGIATNSTSQDEILLKGTIKVSSSLSGLSAGQMVYLSNTVVGGITGTAPSTSNHIIRVIGHVISPTDSTIYFNPDVSFAVIA